MFWRFHRMGSHALTLGCLCLVGTLSGSARAQAQQTEDPAIAVLRMQESEAVAAGDADAVRRLYFAMIDLERRRAAAGDYTGALRAQSESASLEKAHGPMQPERVGLRLALNGRQARTTGAVRFDRGENALVGWKSTGNEARWDVRGIVPGRYDIFASYSAGDEEKDPDGAVLRAGGSFVVRQATGLTGVALERIVHEVAPTGGWEKFVSVKCGQLSIDHTSATIVVECASAEALGMMHLRRIELREMPAADAGSSDDIRAQFSALRAAHAGEVDMLLAPIEKEYMRALQKDAGSPLAKAAADRLRAEVAARRQLVNDRDAGDIDPTGEIVLSATDKLTSLLSGSAAIHSTGEYVTGLRPPDSYVQWTLARLRVPPGDYEVEIDFRATEKMGGKFRLRCGSELITGQMRSGQAGVRKHDFRAQRFGPLRVTPAARTIRFEPLELDTRNGTLCDLRSITLRRRSPAKHQRGPIR